MKPADIEREARRQADLLGALLGDLPGMPLDDWMRDGARLERGLDAYRANAGALAERALAAAFPTVVQLVGVESFGALARAHWRAHPPDRGDIAEWGAELPEFMANDAQLDEEPYLADVARLDWAVHRAGSAADDLAPPAGLDRLVEADPGATRLRLRAGCAVVDSVWPVVSIWEAHRRPPAADDETRFAAVRAAFDAGIGETAFVMRGPAPRVSVEALAPLVARFVGALLARHDLARALDVAGGAFEFEPWLIAALREGLIAAAEPVASMEES